MVAWEPVRGCMGGSSSAHGGWWGHQEIYKYADHADFSTLSGLYHVKHVKHASNAAQAASVKHAKHISTYFYHILSTTCVQAEALLGGSGHLSLTPSPQARDKATLPILWRRCRI